MGKFSTASIISQVEVIQVGNKHPRLCSSTSTVQVCHNSGGMIPHGICWRPMPLNTVKELAIRDTFACKLWIIGRLLGEASGQYEVLVWRLYCISEQLDAFRFFFKHGARRTLVTCGGLGEMVTSCRHLVRTDYKQLLSSALAPGLSYASRPERVGATCRSE